MNVPSLKQIPSELTEMRYGCALVAIWAVVFHFGESFDLDEVCRKVDFDPQNGTYTIALVSFFESLDYQVIFHTDPDPFPSAIEQKHLRLIKKNKTKIIADLTLNSLQQYQNKGWLAILAMETENGGHFSLFDSLDEHYIYFHNHKKMKKNTFEK